VSTSNVTDLTQQGRPYRGASALERRQQRRAQLLDAAIEVFGTSGYHAATVAQICSVAGLTKRYFYESFADSEALLIAAYTEVTDALRARVSAAAVAAGPELEAMTHAGLVEFFTAIDEDPGLVRIAFFEILGVSPAVDAVYRRSTGEFVDVLLALGRTSFDSQGVGPEARATLATGLVGSILMIAQRWVLEQRRQPIEAVVSAAHRIVLGAFGEPRFS
jgi:AcrR family transcriptional regulator